MARAVGRDETERNELARDQVAHGVGGQPLPGRAFHPRADLVDAPAAVHAALGDRRHDQVRQQGQLDDLPVAPADQEPASGVAAVLVLAEQAQAVGGQEQAGVVN